MAVWDPNMIAITNLTCEGIEFVATNDAENTCYNDEPQGIHFLDTHLWGELRERNPVDFYDLLPPNPPYTKVVHRVVPEHTYMDWYNKATLGDAKVIGKLKNPLPVAMVGHPSSDTVFLQNVLVVHKFPIPFHLTVKLKPEEKSYIYAHMWDIFCLPKCEWKRDYRRVFPERYHSHPFFNITFSDVSNAFDQKYTVKRNLVT